VGDCFKHKIKILCRFVLVKPICQAISREKQKDKDKPTRSLSRKLCNDKINRKMHAKWKAREVEKQTLCKTI